MSLDGLRSRMRVIDVSNVPQSKETSTSCPPGFRPGAGAASSSSTSTAHQAVEETPELYRRRTAALSSLSFSPLKQVGMTSFMMYMTGTNLHFFSILTVINGIYSPITAVLRSGQVFQRIEGSKVDVMMPRVTYCACLNSNGLIHLAGLLFAVYRVALMGLLPVNVGDWSGSIVGGQRGEGWRGVQAAL